MTLAELLYWVGLAAVAVSAVTGVFEAERKGLDLVGTVTVALATGLGGGTLRDLLLQHHVFWVADQTYVVAAFATGVITFFLARKRNIPPRLFLYPDALGLALFTVIGTQFALQWEAPWLVASLMGVITGVFGGVLRDIFCNQVPLVFLPGELYASAAWAGALLLIALQALGVAPSLAAWLSAGLIFFLRWASIAYRIHLPTFGQR